MPTVQQSSRRRNSDIRPRVPKQIETVDVSPRGCMMRASFLVDFLFHRQTIADFFDPLNSLGQLYGSLGLWEAGNSPT
jgi:hypothetical protein